MRVLLTSEARFERTPEGTIWGAAAHCTSMWQRYLEVFSDVAIAARVAAVQRPSAGHVTASGRGIAFYELPAYSQLTGFLRNVGEVRAVIAGALRRCEAVIVRSPSPIAYLTVRALASSRPYGAHIVGDPDQVFSTGAFRHPLRLPLRIVATSAQRRLARNAAAVLFVTKGVLQGKYPSRGTSYASSDVALDDAAFRDAQSDFSRGTSFTLVTVAALDQPYKGISVLLEAIAHLRRCGPDVQALIVGGGRLLPELRERAAALGVTANVRFLGQLDRAGVQSALDSADLFVLPSLTEGLPRALLEAMARGLPAIASDVGGIPELLPAECLVPRGDPMMLANRVAAFMTDAAARAQAAERNTRIARQYHEREQAVVRRAFLSAVRDASARRSGRVDD